MDDENKPDEPKVQADNNSIAVAGINIRGDVSGNITIGNTGYTPEEVSVLITQIKSTFQPKPFDGRCPYKGLDVFEEEDAELFFGREKLVHDLVSRLKESRIVFVTGPSGSGKSSLVRAGLIHALKNGAIKNSERWLYATMKPGRDPLGELGRVASSLADSTNAEDEIRAKAITDATIFARWCEIALKEGRDKRVVLFIDQFEEVFTQINNEAERVAFLNLLTHAATVENGRVIILFSMRSDFVSNCATYPQLNALLNQQFVQIGAMQPEELVSAIAQPALRVGLRIDPDLIAQIINEMKGEPGALPLMQFALKDLFDSQQEKRGVPALTLNDYLQRGGIHKALERHADDSFSKLTKNEQELARSIFSGLIEIGRGTQDTKRTALFDELIPANTKAEDVETIVQKLADARLITTDEQAGKDTVTISHEKLIDAWPWLKKLVNENRDVIALQNEISADAKQWEEHKRDASYLYTGGRLANVREQLEKQKFALSHLAQEFVRAGRARQRRTQTFLISTVSIALIAAIVASLLFQNQAQANIEIASTAQAASTDAVAQKATALANAEDARAGELATLAINKKETNYDLGLLFALESVRLRKNAQTEGSLLTLINSHPGLNLYLNGHSNDITSVAFSPDGKMLASGSADKTIILWDVRDPTNSVKLSTLGHNGSITSIAFSLGGQILVSGGDNHVMLWDVSNPIKPVNLFTLPATGYSVQVAFSPDGKTLASASSGIIVLWDISNPETSIKLSTMLLEQQNYISCIAFSPDGKVLASGNYVDGTAILWDVSNSTSPQKVATLSMQSDSGSATDNVDGKMASNLINVNFLYSAISQRSDPSSSVIDKTLKLGGSNPEGVRGMAYSLLSGVQTLALGSLNGKVIFWDITEPAKPKKLSTLSGYSNDLSSLAFSQNDEMLAVSGSDGTIILWDVKDLIHPKQFFVLSGHSNAVSSLSFNQTGKMLASGGSDKSVILWNVRNINTPIQVPILSGHSQYISSISFGQNGNKLASGGYDGYVSIWDVSNPTRANKLSFLPTYGTIYSIAFDLQSGKTLATTSTENNGINIWDTSDPINPVLSSTLLKHQAPVSSLAFSPDGKILASGSWDGTIILWDMNNPANPVQLFTIGEQGFQVYCVAFNQNGKILASGAGTNVSIWDVSNPDEPVKLSVISGLNSNVNSVFFNPDGTMLASGHLDGTITLWNVSDPTKPGKLSVLSGHKQDITSVAFSPDGKTLASGSRDQTVMLWDVSISTNPIQLSTLSGKNGLVNSLVFNPNGKILASGDGDRIILWDIDIQSWIQKACQRVGRNFTKAEWALYFPGETYHATCSQWSMESEATTTPTTQP